MVEQAAALGRGRQSTDVPEWTRAAARYHLGRHMGAGGLAQRRGLQARLERKRLQVTIVTDGREGEGVRRLRNAEEVGRLVRAMAPKLEVEVVALTSRSLLDQIATMKVRGWSNSALHRTAEHHRFHPSTTTTSCIALYATVIITTARSTSATPRCCMHALLLLLLLLVVFLLLQTNTSAWF